jgi:hypothetical protein
MCSALVCWSVQETPSPQNSRHICNSWLGPTSKKTCTQIPCAAASGTRTLILTKILDLLSITEPAIRIQKSNKVEIMVRLLSVCCCVVKMSDFWDVSAVQNERFGSAWLLLLSGSLLLCRFFT